MSFLLGWTTRSDTVASYPGLRVYGPRNCSYAEAWRLVRERDPNLKVAGVDKGRRTKILEKEILPGKHEIVQGGYGKYQGTWYAVVL